MSCSWQQTRAARALEHELSVLGIDFTEDGDVVFHVDGLSDVYRVSINQDATLFCPDCDCNDSIFRGPDLRCKHICHVLLALGLPREDVEDPFYEPSQADLIELLASAPDIVAREVWGDRRMAQRTDGAFGTQRTCQTRLRLVQFPKENLGFRAVLCYENECLVR